MRRAISNDNLITTIRDQRRELGHDVYLSLGCNLGLCSNNLQKAIRSITESKGLRLIKSSAVYRTEPQDRRRQPWFFNQVVLLEVGKFWTPWSLLHHLRDIEKSMGRCRSTAKGPRLIDLDILIFGKLILNSNDIKIPHSSMKKRAFVLVPMKEIDPEYHFPEGESLQHVLEQLYYRVEGDRIYQP